MTTISATTKMEKDDETKPLWKYVTKVRKTSIGGGGNAIFTCNLCELQFTGSYTRVRAHLLKISGTGVRVCAKVSMTKLNEFKKMDNEASLKIQNSKKKNVSLPGESTQKQDIISSNPVAKGFNMQARDVLDARIARMFFSGGLSLNLARNPYFMDAFSYAANTNNLSGYKPPGYNKLRTTLLASERSHVENLLKPIVNSWSQKGVTIVSDGWSDPQRRALINFMAVTESGPMFLKAVNCFGEIKDKDFIARLMKEVIMEVGPSNVVQVITDNAAVCKAAGMIIENEFPAIYWTPCVVHTLNLALKNICAAGDTDKNNVTFEQCGWITQIADDAKMIKNFIMGHSMRLSMYNNFNKLKLLSIAATRFASTIVMLRRFKCLKEGLRKMVISHEWSTYKEDDIGLAKRVKEILLDDIWWDKVDYILSFTAPIFDVLRKTDTDMTCLHLVYEMWDSMIENVRKVIYQHERKAESEVSHFYEVVHQILLDRWTKSNTPLHCLAHSLNPRYYSQEWLNEDPLRIPPHQDIEITNERKRCFKRYFEDVDVRRRVNMEFANFSGGREGFDDFDSLRDRGMLDAKSWWLIHGAHAPTLQKIAIKLLGQPSSSSCCERNWSTYSFIHSLKRNKLTPKRAEDLVYVHSNLRLLSRNSSKYNEGESRMWDIAGDEFSLDDDGIPEMTNLSLDEPELEAIYFNEDDQ